MNAATTVDLSPIVQALISLGALALTAVGTWVLSRIAAYFKVSTNSAAMQSFDDALTRAIQAAASGATAQIAARGWDHVDVKNAVIAAAAPYALSKFGPALKSVGLDPADPNGATTAYVTAELNRLFATAMAPVAASPVTPPVPAPPPAAVPPVNPAPGAAP